jgi:transcriptional regulator with XRE-family HTH domain
MVSDSANNTLGHGLWYHIGARLRSRRAELGLAEGIVAAHLGIPVRNYQQYEAGRDRIPAALLLQASELFKIPLSSFFKISPLATIMSNKLQMNQRRSTASPQLKIN